MLTMVILWSCEPNEPDSIYRNTAPVIKDQSFTAKENINDTYVIGTVTATDEVDNNKITFSIETDESGLFEITSSGNLSLIQGKSLDFETAQKHTLTVRAYDGIVGRYANISIVVENVLDGSLELNTYALTLYPYPQFAETLEVISDLEGNTVVWSSSDENVATVEENGLVTPLSLGTATITATVGDESAQCNVEVIDGPVTQLEIDLTDLELYTGESQALSIQTLEADVEQIGDPVWSSDDQTVATVDQNGTVTAIAPGTATITVAVDNASASCTVTVNPNVYVAGTSGSFGNYKAMLWINDDPITLSDGPNESVARSVYVDPEGKFYVAGYETINGINVAMLWKQNGDDIQAAPLSNPNRSAEANEVFVNDNGTTFVVGHEEIGGTRTAMLWRNQVSNILPYPSYSSASSVYVDDAGNVYIAGDGAQNGTPVAVLWENEVPTDLTTVNGNNSAFASSVSGNGADVYVVGQEAINNIFVAKIWKNDGTTVNLTDGTNNNQPSSVFVDGVDVYVAATETQGQGMARVWKNDEVIIEDSNCLCFVSSVFVHGTDVYVAGYKNENGISIAKLWKNGMEENSYGEGVGASVFVK